MSFAIPRNIWHTALMEGPSTPVVTWLALALAALMAVADVAPKIWNAAEGSGVTSGQVTSLANQVSGLNGAVATLSARIDGLKDAIATMPTQKQMSDMQDAVNKNESRMYDMRDRLTALETLNKERGAPDPATVREPHGKR